MTELLEKTWFIWWIVATLAILRWFHVVSINAGVELELEDTNIEALFTIQKVIDETALFFAVSRSCRSISWR